MTIDIDKTILITAVVGLILISVGDFIINDNKTQVDNSSPNQYGKVNYIGYTYPIGYGKIQHYTCNPYEQPFGKIVSYPIAEDGTNWSDFYEPHPEKGIQDIIWKCQENNCSVYRPSCGKIAEIKFDNIISYKEAYSVN